MLLSKRMTSAIPYVLPQIIATNTFVRAVKRDENAGTTMSFQHLGGWSRKIGNLRQA